MNLQMRRELANLHSQRHRSHEKKAVRIIHAALLQQAKIISKFVNTHGIPTALSHLEKLIKPELVRNALMRVWFSVSKDYHKIGMVTKSVHESYMTQYANSPAAAAKVTRIDAETRSRVQAALQEATVKKLHKREAAKLISGSTGFSKNRSLLIARTETTMAANMGAYSSAKDNGGNFEKYWIATDDERTREAHAEVGNKPIPMDEAFEVGGEKMMFPGDPRASAENVCNCRCIVAFKPVPVIASPEGNDEGSGGERNDINSTVATAIAAIIDRITAGNEGAN